MSIKSVAHEHEHLVSMINQLLNEREVLHRENQYLKAKLNDSILMETINEMKKERNVLLTILSNLTISNNQEESSRSNLNENNSDFYASPSYSKLNVKTMIHNKPISEHNLTFPRYNSSIKPNCNRVFRLKTNNETSQPASMIYRIDSTKENLLNNSDRSSSTSSIAHTRTSQSSKTSYAYKTSIIPQVSEPKKPTRKYNFQLKHSQNSPFKHYRSQSLQDLT